MKHTLLKTAFLLAISFLIMGCNVRIPSNTTPKPTVYGMIDQIKITNGYPLKKEPWVVISDRNSNVVFMKKGDEKSPKEIKFLEPLLVVKHKDARGLVKVAAYNPDALLQKLPSKSVKTYGWIPEDQLLLWTNSVKNDANGFNIKATLTPNRSDVLKNGDKYLKNDSVLVFTSPDLTNQAKVKLPIGQLVYIYKKAEDSKRYLIGKSPSVKIDSISKNLYGWVSSNIVTLWGDKSALRVSPDYKFAGENDLSVTKESFGGAASTTFPVSDAINRDPLQNIISTNPLNAAMATKGKFYTNALDYSKNFIYNILGQPLYHPQYKEIISKNKNLNIVLTVDASNENDQNIAVAKSTLQDLSLKLKNIKYFRQVNFGVVLYKNNSCGEDVAASELTADPEKVSQYIDRQIILMRCSGYGGQPMQKGMEMAGQVLADHKNETNVVVLIGANSSQSNMGNAISNLSAARARIISYQTFSGNSESSNNFVLLSENIITNSGKNIAELEKERIADQAMVLNKNDYSLLQQEEGLFSLDYPKKSMWQGFVIYPKKGDFNSSALLSKSLDSLLSQATAQNKFLEKSLTKYFQSSLANTRTEIKPDFRSEYSDVPAPLPTETSSQFVKYDNPFLTKGTYTDDFKNSFPVVQKGILISEPEYNRLRNLYEEIYKETFSFSKTFSQSSAVNAYIKILKKYNLSTEKLRSSDLKTKSMAYSVGLSTGFDTSADEILSKYMLAGWKQSKVMPEEAVKAYFKQFRLLADRLLENKSNPKIKIDQNGETYYWLSNYFAPLITPQQSL
ncbi:VWA domain-containing protein [Kaistella sp. G5-32]|uniref:VWA domain-containing protein n=1 Tax=Kaistella gelatinilytica TaxID=2787636 RepID=A0ABS0FF74_9FLAO|nr:type VI secretion system protein TssR domain-containing protein [Kaistella gelatinilytica]MBF8458381.1 VWA domain-containing protein [Kaistella gelatinilytica]